MFLSLAVCRKSARHLHYLKEVTCRMPNPFDDKTIMNWFFASCDPAPCRENFISTVGSFPILEGDFDTLLRSGSLEVHYITEDTDVLIIGKEEWFKEDISKLLDMREGKSLRVYSQEMFLSYWACGRDPFEEEREILEAFGEGHPALDFLSNTGFDWPSTFVHLNGSGEFASELLKIGLLKHMGYKVGERGLPTNKRRTILSKVFKFELPKVDLPVWYIEQWGEPNSGQRLKKMADSLATFRRREKKLNHLKAASDYETDLEWLHRKFYKGRFRFLWPDVYVR